MLPLQLCMLLQPSGRILKANLRLGPARIRSTKQGLLNTLLLRLLAGLLQTVSRKQAAAEELAMDYVGPAEEFVKLLRWAD